MRNECHRGSAPASGYTHHLWSLSTHVSGTWNGKCTRLRAVCAGRYTHSIKMELTAMKAGIAFFLPSRIIDILFR